jgi:predicted RNase H-like nuclease
MPNHRLPPSSVTRVGAHELAVLDWIGKQVGLQSRRKVLDHILLWLGDDAEALETFKSEVAMGQPNVVGNQTFSEAAQAAGMTLREFAAEVMSA